MDSPYGFKQALPTEMAIVDFNKALQILKDGDVLGIPTETVYGLAARIDSPSSLKKIFETKKRPFFDPLIVHLAPTMNPKDYTSQWPAIYEELAKAFWPGPLTLIAPKNDKISDLITSGLPDVGLRMPKTSITQRLLEALQIPVAAPSANLFGRTSPTTALHVEEEFQGKVAVLDGGEAEVGIESTVVTYSENEKTLFIIRPGLINKEKLTEVASPHGIRVQSGQSKAAPGQLKHHYQPSIPLVIDFTADDFTDGTSLSEEKKKRFEEKLHLNELSWAVMTLPNIPVVAARTLYAELRRLSKSSHQSIWLPLKPELKNDPEWEMILDRLYRAASLINDQG